MLNPTQLHKYVIKPSLDEMAAIRRWPVNTLASRRLVLLTGLAESRLEYLHQLGGGPALGLYQMEPATHDWMQRKAVRWGLLSRPHEALITDLSYATMMCRLRYWVVPAALPDASDGMGMANYHKRHYNTSAGAARPSKTVKWWPLVVRSVPA